MGGISWLVGQPASPGKKNGPANRHVLIDNITEFRRQPHFHCTKITAAKMPAPTALVRQPQDAADDVAMEAINVPLPADDDTELIDMSLDSAPTATDAPTAGAEDTPMVDETGRPKFAPAKSIPLAFRREQRKVPIPPHRMSPLKAAWPKIYVWNSYRLVGML